MHIYAPAAFSEKRFEKEAHIGQYEVSILKKGF
jgi:hypothetical protein